MDTTGNSAAKQGNPIALNKELEAKVLALAKAEMAGSGANRRLDMVSPSVPSQEVAVVAPVQKEVKNWANLFTGNKLASKGVNLQFIAHIITDGVKVAQLEKLEIVKETETWKEAMILYVVGDSPTIGAVYRPPPECVKVMDPSGTVFNQYVTYERWPTYYPTCCQIGHTCQEPQSIQTQKSPKPRGRLRSIEGSLRRISRYGSIRICKVAPPAVVVQSKGPDHVYDGWQSVKGKSASKFTVSTQEQVVETANDFVSLEDTTFQQVFQAAMSTH
ncbi:hypothetical protein K7X08_010068 [Anisodus acutangulus]|uniref:Uncharacterized protein n=1 Tax=Anisodus acutangulus TaxID=402998 RepID=A0A9Q1N0F2_9SOLA|nr:hypothetical protein K7X08_010068 [Anisodus acutangulus]